MEETGQPSSLATGTPQRPGDSANTGEMLNGSSAALLRSLTKSRRRIRFYRLIQVTPPQQDHPAVHSSIRLITLNTGT
jgi:hypothetical protein